MENIVRLCNCPQWPLCGHPAFLTKEIKLEGQQLGMDLTKAGFMPTNAQVIDKPVFAPDEWPVQN